MIDPRHFSEFARAGAATVYEANGRQGDVSPDIRAMVPGAAVAGRAFCVSCHPGDNLAIHRAVAVAEKGDILVVAGHGKACGYIGDILGEAAVCRGIVGAVVDGSVRDIAELRKLPFPVWARSFAIRSASKHQPGKLAVAIECGGVTVAHGDTVVCDDDGVCIVASAATEAVLRATRARLQAETDFRSRLRQGALTLDLLDLRAVAEG